MCPPPQLLPDKANLKTGQQRCLMIYYEEFIRESLWHMLNP